jgi:hypothetical protein
MASVMLTALARQMLAVVVENGGAASFDQMRDHRRKSSAELVLRVFTDYGLVEKKGDGYVVTPAGVLAHLTGFYESKWANAAPAVDKCATAISEALAPLMQVTRVLIGPDFNKQVVGLLSKKGKDWPLLTGTCPSCKAPTPAAILGGEAVWKCSTCRKEPAAV